MMTMSAHVFECVEWAGGDAHLGGDDITGRTLTYFTRVFQKKTGKDMTKDAKVRLCLHFVLLAASSVHRSYR
eukprot:COSAG06_NODE_7396_length_2518_cov_1.825134_2_plen_72_part_00